MKLVRASLVAVLAVVAAFGFRGVFPDWTFLPAAVIGAVGAIVVSVVARHFRLAVTEALLASLVAFAALGILVAGSYPTFFSGLVNGWARVLSSVPPANLIGEYRVLPYAVGWLGAMVGGELLRVRRAAGLAVIGPLAGFVLTSLISLEHRTVALVQGGVLAAGALVLGYLQQRRDQPDEAAAVPWGRTAAAIGMAAAVAAGAAVIGPRVPTAEAHERFDLRRFQEPPFDPLDEPTPLGQVKTGLQEANADQVVFTVTSAEPIDRITLATLDNFNGEHWMVADESPGAPAEFRPIDAVFPAPTDGTIRDWERTTATITIEHLADLATGEFDPVWLPVPGWPLTVRPDTDDQLDLRFNAATGTIALAPDGPSQGLTYTVGVARPPAASDLDLAGAAVTARDPYDLAVPQLRAFAGDVLEGADLGWEQVEAIRSRLVDTGAYDSRADSPTARPGHHLGRLAEFLADPERIVGFEEQYAAAAALLARSEGLPARVAVGFLVPDDELADRTVNEPDGAQVTVLANDINAWIEVRFDEFGWIPFDVTPPRERLPEDTPVGRTRREVAVPNPPPEPPPPAIPPDLDVDTELDEDEEEQPDEPTAAGGGFPWRTVAISTAIASPFVLLVGAMVAVIVLKRRRSARRRSGPPAARVAGAWYELVDRLTEQGAAPPRAATRREVALGLREAEVVAPDEADALLALADDVDLAAFHPEPPPDDVADRAWDRAELVTCGLWARRSPVRRAVQRVDPRPLLRREETHVDA